MYKNTSRPHLDLIQYELGLTYMLSEIKPVGKNFPSLSKSA